jgi:hypothetical protein
MLIPFVKCLRLLEITCSQEVASFLLQMAAPAPCSGTFLEQFGTPTLLWRMLRSVGYTEAPCYLDIERAARRHTLVWGCAGGSTASHQSTVAWLACEV